jgi:hypothetical protein
MFSTAYKELHSLFAAIVCLESALMHLSVLTQHSALAMVTDEMPSETLTEFEATGLYKVSIAYHRSLSLLDHKIQPSTSVVWTWAYAKNWIWVQYDP